MMLRMKIYLVLFLLLAAEVSFSQKAKEHIVLLNAVAHIGNGKVIEKSVVIINKNKIELVADATTFQNNNKYDTVIDLSGKHIYPALINTNNILGLHDAEAVRATVDFAEIGQFNSHVRTLIAYNTDNIISPTVKTNGVLYTQATPRGWIISGSSSVMALEGWNWEDAVLKADDGIHVNFPRMVEKKWSEENGVTTSANKKYKDEMQRLEKFFADGIAYCNSTPPSEKNIRFEALRPVINGSANLYLHADKVKDIISAINFFKTFNIKKPVIVGGKESYKITSLLHTNKIPVMLNRVNDLPDNADDEVDIIYRLPYLLQKDSVLFCLQLEGDMEAMQSRNLPFNAGAAAAYGLTKEEALSAISLNAAKILGVDALIGSLEPGKLASLVVSNGDILDMRTNSVILAYLAGKQVSLNNRQTELYIKYKNKYNLK